MKALGIAFSARKRGNCLDCLEYVLAKLKGNGFESKVINAFNLNVKPCSHCNYECFSQELRDKDEECPIKDDVPRIYSEMQASDIIVLAVPTYGGKAASLYCAFTERWKGIMKSYGELRNTILNKITALIVIGNAPAGGDFAYHMVILDHHDCEHPPPAVLLQSTEYGRRSISGDLLEEEKIRDRLDNLVNSILRNWRSKR